MILLVFFSVIVPPFRTTENYISILVATAVNGVLAMGVTFVIITGGIDLSVGTDDDLLLGRDGHRGHEPGHAALARHPGRARRRRARRPRSTAS